MTGFIPVLLYHSVTEHRVSDYRFAVSRARTRSPSLAGP
jgi:hypothetical protein